MYGTVLRGLLYPLLLLLILERPGHGYDLIERLSCLGVEGVEPAHVYKILRNLERQRLLVSVWVTSDFGPPRRRYELTADGLAELRASMARLGQLNDMLDHCLARWASTLGSPEAPALNGIPAQRPNGRVSPQPWARG